MPIYNVYGKIYASKYIGKVEASSKEEAEELAWSELDTWVSVCHHCASEVEDPEISELIIEED